VSTDSCVYLTHPYMDKIDKIYKKRHIFIAFIFIL